MSADFSIYAKASALGELVTPEGNMSELQSIEPSLPRKEWPDPTQEMIESNGFMPIWDCIKSWDIGVRDVYSGYSGATGNHVRSIMDELWRRGFKIVPIEDRAA